MQLKFKMKVLNKIEKNNELLSRKEFIIDLEYDGPTPTKQDVKTEICKSLKFDEKLCVIRKISVVFKANTANVDVLVYSNEEDMKRIENYLMHKKIEEKIKKEEEARKKAEEEAKRKAEEEAKSAEETAENNSEEDKKEE